jgi:hypothetical protein
LPFNPAISFLPDGKIHSAIAVSLWQSNGKVEKFDCDFLRLDALLGLTILCALLSICTVTVVVAKLVLSLREAIDHNAPTLRSTVENGLVWVIGFPWDSIIGRAL